MKSCLSLPAILRRLLDAAIVSRNHGQGTVRNSKSIERKWHNATQYYLAAFLDTHVYGLVI